MIKQLLILLLIPFHFGFSQEEKTLTKMDRFVSNTGSIVKLENFYLTEQEGYSEIAKVQVRKASIGGDVAFFLQIIKEDKYGNKNASIAEEDLVEVIKAYDELVIQSKNEETSADYFENKFTTDDGFQIGYGGSEDILWFITLEKYGKSTIIFAGPVAIGLTLKEGLKKIKSLKS